MPYTYNFFYFWKNWEWLIIPPYFYLKRTNTSALQHPYEGLIPYDTSISAYSLEDEQDKGNDNALGHASNGLSSTSELERILLQGQMRQIRMRHILQVLSDTTRRVVEDSPWFHSAHQLRSIVAAACNRRKHHHPSCLGPG